MRGLSKKPGPRVIVVIYVDDLLVGSISLKGVSDVREALQEKLKVKTTGTLGQHIVRPVGSSDILLRVPPEYLKGLFMSDPFCCGPKSSDTPPDLLQVLEKGVKDHNCVQPLSDEAAARYKRVIGKLSWWAQSRPDQAGFLSILATGQGTPSNLHVSLSGMFVANCMCFSVFHQGRMKCCLSTVA